MGLAKTFRVPLISAVVVIVGAGVIGGPQIGLLVLLLAILEVSISFDNAIVNASVLEGMSPFWQRVFLTWGILIAVFGMRLLFPILIVAAAASLSIPTVVNEAINHPSQYAHHLESANPIIAAFGGTFLLMVALNFFFDSDKDSHWLTPLEKPMAGLGNFSSIATGVAVAMLLVADQTIVHQANRLHVLVAGLAGMLIYLGVSGLADLIEPDEDGGDEEAGGTQRSAADAARTAAKLGLATFLYLEVLDASFSFDGVIGAFAVSKNIFVIAAGLGLGALFIRTLTVWLVRAGTLQEYAYLEHGAHWAIGALAVLLFISIEHHIPELVTGLVGAAMIGSALLTSIVANRREAATAS